VFELEALGRLMPQAMLNATNMKGSVRTNMRVILTERDDNSSSNRCVHVIFMLSRLHFGEDVRSLLLNFDETAF